MRALRVLSAVFALLLFGVAAPFTTLPGYTTVGSDRERALERTFLDIPSAAGALETTTALAAQPHPAGSAADYRTAVEMRDQLAGFGFNAALETLTARVDTPKNVALTFYPDGRTPPIPTRAAEARGLLSRPRGPRPTPAPGLAPVKPVPIDLAEPPIPGDAETADKTIAIPFLAGSADGDVAGPLVYVGFGTDAAYALLAAHAVDVRGAIAIARESSEFRGIVARRAQARGLAGVLFYDDPAEDGSTRGAAYPFGPYRPSTSVRRGSVGEGVTIPVLPISAATAQTLIGALHGPSAAPPWAGSLPVGYPFARGPASVRLSVQLTRKQTTLWNTIGVLAGVHPDQTVLMGAHRDALVFGAEDDGSGIATLIEAARGFGYITKTGWRPQRSIVVAGWDGEELGAYGTIAYVKRHDSELHAGAIAYLDAEQTVTGAQFGADTVAAIAPIVADATHEIRDPVRPGTTLYDRWGFRSRTPPLRSFGPGSVDHPALLFGIGTPSVNAGFSGAFGTYHSAYDTITYATTFGDPQFVLHQSAAQLYGIIAMRLADADVVPYAFGAYVPLMQNALGALAAAAKAGGTTVDAAGLRTSIGRFGAAARRFDTATANVATIALTGRAIEAVQVLDIAVYGSDGYAGATFPEIAHATATADQSAVDRSIARTRTAIDHAADLLGL